MVPHGGQEYILYPWMIFDLKIISKLIFISNARKVKYDDQSYQRKGNTLNFMNEKKSEEKRLFFMLKLFSSLLK